MESPTTDVSAAPSVPADATASSHATRTTAAGARARFDNVISSAFDEACRAAGAAEALLADKSPAEAGPAFRDAVAAIVAACKEEQLPPERVIVLLKRALNSGLLKHGYSGDQRRLREIVLACFLTTWYGRGGDVPRSVMDD